MAEKDSTLTSAEFSQITGIAVSTINLMLRQGRLRGEKRGGRWSIPTAELQSAVVASRNAPAPAAGPSASPASRPAAASGQYDVETFARMTYLTEKGVRQWLKIGRLTGGVDADGKAFVSADNLDRSDLRHLIRP